MPQLFSNGASTTLLNSISNVSTTIIVAGGTGDLFPDISGSDYFLCTLEDNGGNYEIVKCTSRTGDSFIVQRAQELTTAKAFSAGHRFELRFTAGTVEVFLQRDGDVVDGGLY